MEKETWMWKDEGQEILHKKICQKKERVDNTKRAVVYKVNKESTSSSHKIKTVQSS